MDNPTPPNDAKSLWDSLITGVIGLAGIIGARLIWRSKSKVDAERSLEAKNIGWTQSIITVLREEVAAIRKESNDEIAALHKRASEEILAERARADIERNRADDYQQRALTCESLVPYLQKEIESLKKRVAELEARAGGARDRRN